MVSRSISQLSNCVGVSSRCNVDYCGQVHSLMKRGMTLGGARVASVLLSTSFPARAQSQGFAIDRFDPSERGSDWFVLESLDLRGHVRPAAGLVMEYAYRPLVIYNQDGSVRA